MKLTWSKFGEVLSLLGVFYFVGFLLFGIISLVVVLPRYGALHESFGQVGIARFILDMVGPLTPLFILISAAAWYQGRRLTKQAQLDMYDHFVAVATFAATILILTPQLYIAITSLIPIVLR